MTLSVTHTKVVTTTDDGTSEVGSDEWNAGHSISGATQNTILFADDTTSISSMAGTSWDDTNRSLTLTGATVTANHPVFDLTQTWNNGAVTFTGLKLNIAETAAAAASMLCDIQHDSSTVLSLTNSGELFITTDLSATSGSAFPLTLQTPSSDTSVFSRFGDSTNANFLIFGSGRSGDKVGRFFYNGGGGQTFEIGRSSYATTSYVPHFVLGATGGLSLVNSTSQADLWVYNTITNASNYERLFFGWSTNVATIDVQVAGSGTQRVISLNHLDAATASGTATFAATNCPATTLTSPYTWIKVTSSDGSIVYMPAWK